MAFIIYEADITIVKQHNVDGCVRRILPPLIDISSCHMISKICKNKCLVVLYTIPCARKSKEVIHVKTVIKVIKKYSSMGVSQFLLDTYKLDAGKVNENSWLELQQNMVAINDVIKSESKNVHIMITFQLAKGSVNQRYYTQDNIGMSKNIIDPCSTCLMIRNLYDDEKPGGNKEIKIFRPEGEDGKTKIQVSLDKNKNYQIIFIIKNREGAANQYQVVVEHDMSRNIMKEIGICNVPIDF